MIHNNVANQAKCGQIAQETSEGECVSSLKG